MIVHRSHHAAGPHGDRDGLTGRTEAERREIETRIDRISEAKARAEGRPLTPFEIALALGMEDRDPKMKKCKGCKSSLPDTPEYFHRKGRDRLHFLCKPCKTRYDSKYKRGQRKTPAQLQAGREYIRRIRAQRRTAGIPDPYETGVRGKLTVQRKHARKSLRRAVEPARIESLKAKIANLTHEIDRIDREAGR